MSAAATGSVPRALVLAKLSKLPDSAPVVDAVEAMPGRKIDSEGLEALLAEHRSALGSDARAALEELVRHAGKGSGSVFQVFDQGPELESLTTNAKPLAARVLRGQTFATPAFTGPQSPRSAAEADGVTTGTWAIQVHVPGAGSPLMLPEGDVLMWHKSALVRVAREDGALSPIKELGAGLPTTPILSNDGKTVFFSLLDPARNEEQVHAVDVQTGDTLWTHAREAGNAAFAPLALSPDGATLFQAGPQSEFRAFDTGNGDLRWSATLKGNAPYPNAVVSPSGKLVCVATSSHLHAFAADTGAPLWNGPVRVAPDTDQKYQGSRMEFSRDGRTLMVPVTGGLGFFDAVTGEAGTHLPMSNFEGQGVVLSANGKTAVVGDSTRSVMVVDVASETARKITLDNGVALRGTAAFANDDTEVIVADSNSNLTRVRLSDGAVSADAPNSGFIYRGEVLIPPGATHALSMGINAFFSVALPPPFRD